ncbi:hypothetical protein ACRALDRAFT_208753 [Sodiomyces alcalophilus JCM 7366]|uniref:uncharacterized protein n=1 Tax=Sodiomyces alcalophilus JCM 7366 TaxID=591952 RepID=UPI0039B4D733
MGKDGGGSCVMECLEDDDPDEIRDLILLVRKRAFWAEFWYRDGIRARVEPSSNWAG